ncbi:MAG: hypothetical protein ACLR5G_01580 [Eubacteriales bacterium]
MSKYDFRGAPEAPAIEELWLNTSTATYSSMERSARTNTSV